MESPVDGNARVYIQLVRLHLTLNPSPKGEGLYSIAKAMVGVYLKECKPNGRAMMKVVIFE